MKGGQRGDDNDGVWFELVSGPPDPPGVTVTGKAPVMC